MITLLHSGVPILTTAFCLVASSVASDSPSQVTKQYFGALAQGDLNKAMRCCADNVTIGMIKFDQQVTAVEVTKEDIRGSAATVQVWLYNKSGRGAGFERLVKQDGGWKVSESCTY